MDSLAREFTTEPNTKSVRDSLIDDFARSAAYAAVQSPLDGVTQLANKVTGLNMPGLDLVHAPEPAPFGSLNWHAQQFGSGVGMALPFIALDKGLGIAGAGGATTAELKLGQRAFNAAASGFVFDAVFRPVADDQVDDFFAARVKNGLLGAATFSSIVGVEAGINKLQARAMGITSAELAARSSLGREMLTHFTAGGIAGAGHAQAESLINRGQFASLKETASGAYQFAFTGASMGAYNRLEKTLWSQTESAGTFKTGEFLPGGKEPASVVTRGARDFADLVKETPQSARPSETLTAAEILRARLSESLARVNSDSPQSWLVPKDAAAYEGARAKAVEMMKKVYDGEPQSLHDLVQDAVAKGRLSADQAKAYEYFMGDIVYGFEQRGAVSPAEQSVQTGNLQHTLREARTLLKDPAIAETSPDNVFKALIGSAMSDARKPGGLLAVANHPYVAAAEAGLPVERALNQVFGDRLPAAKKSEIIDDTSHIVLEHHLQGPRTVLGSWIHLPLIRQSLAKEISSTVEASGTANLQLQSLATQLNGKDPVSLTLTQREALGKLGMQQVAEEIDGLGTLHDKHLNGENYPAHAHPNGPLEIALTPAEQRSLSRLGIAGLFLPNPQSRYFAASQLASVADQVQYVTPIERSIKYDGMYGPEFGWTKNFRASQLGEGSNTAEGSYLQVRGRLSESQRARLDEMLNTTRQVLPGMRSDFVAEWSRGRQLFFDADGKLPFVDSKLNWVPKEQAQPLTAEEVAELRGLSSDRYGLTPDAQFRRDLLLSRRHFEQAVELNAAWIAHLVRKGETRGGASGLGQH